MAHDPEPTDAELIRRSRRDADAFRPVYERHVQSIERWLIGRTGSAQVALELTAETFARAWIARRRFRPPADGSAGPWLQGIANNLFRTWARDRRIATTARARLDMPALSDTIDELIARVDAERMAPQALEHLDKLPVAHRTAVELRVIHDMPYEAIAEQMSSSVDLARMRVMRGLRELNGHLEGGRP